MPLSPMLAAALAVNEAFFFARTGSTAAGRRPVGLSLWNPQSQVNWLNATAGEPELRYLPARLWLIGLGHLGQAYLWGLGLLPYPDPAGLSLVLQDVDIITPSSESTSILTGPSLISQKKTRAMAAWAERRGFSTIIYERLFDAHFTRQPDEPSVALCGLDNGLGRRALDRSALTSSSKRALAVATATFAPYGCTRYQLPDPQPKYGKPKIPPKTLRNVSRTRRC